MTSNISIDYQPAYNEYNDIYGDNTSNTSDYSSHDGYHGDNAYGSYDYGIHGDYDYNDTYEHYDDDYLYQTVLHRVFSFEEYVYLYAWPILVALTTISNILVILVLAEKSMRTSTNIILIAIAISDSMTGLITLPAYLHAYNQRQGMELVLTRPWCQYFMITKLFLTKAFHTMSVWLTLILGFQRLISVSYPFKAQSMFSIKKTFIMIGVIVLFSPVLHIYQVTEEKIFGEYCAWKLEEPCAGGCIYIWISFYLAHFIPCLLLIIFTVIMVAKLKKATEKMSHANMISNEANMRRRNAENRRISVIVIVIVVLFLVPEIPYSIYLVLNVSLKHSGKKLLEFKSNRVFVCSYELLMLLSFHANFWVYLIMNRKFRHGLGSLFGPCTAVVYSVLSDIGFSPTNKDRRRHSLTTSAIRTYHSDVPSSPHEPISDDNGGKPMEMKMYTFNENGKSIPISGEISGL